MKKILEHYVFLSLGGNQGNKKKYLDLSVHYISKNIGKIIKISSNFQTQPWNMKKNTPMFINKVLFIKTYETPLSLLKKILYIENIIGKRKKWRKKKYENRNLDIDILFYDQLIISSFDLTIPHGLLHLRKFVLIPICELDPNKIHPIFNKTVLEILGTCSDNLIVKKL